MSSRQRRLFEKSRDALLVTSEANTAESSSGEEPPEAIVACSNPYGLLEEEHNQSSSQEEEEKDLVVEEVPTPQPVTKKRRQRGRKKKKKKEESQEEAIDDLISTLTLTDTKTDSSPSSSQAPPSELLQVKLKSLKGDEEVNKMFGAQVVASVEAELERKRRKELGIRDRGSSRSSHRFLRRFLLTTPHPDWNFPGSTLSMESKGATEDGEVFEYVGSAKYKDDHEQFVHCQNAGHPNVLASFSNSHPFHVESLLAMYDLLMATGSALHAEECLKRALFVLEVSWHRNFTPTSGKCRLDYKVETNKLLFGALFRHVQELSKRGCLKTAFECSKFLLSLDKSDPLGVLCMIDYLSIRAGEFNFVQQLVSRLDDGPSLAMRPGIAFSLALAKFKLNEGSMESLVQAILMHPVALVRLIGKLKDKGFRLNQQWESLLQNKFFSKADDGGSSSLNHLVNLFVERQHTLYRPQEVVDWLREGCEKALVLREKAELGEDSTAEDWECVRVNFFPPDERNEFQDLHLYDFSDEVQQLPEDVLQMGEGLEDVEAQMAEELERRRGRDGVVRLTDEDLRQGNPFMIFIQSLLPWVQRDSHDQQD